MNIEFLITIIIAISMFTVFAFIKIKDLKHKLELEVSDINNKISRIEHDAMKEHWEIVKLKSHFEAKEGKLL